MIPYNSFEFNGINSMDNGVYISGDAVFNAPERDVEMIVIPGRNGEFIRDNGRFNNIEVTYPCGMFGDDDFAFRTKLRQFRNMLAGQTGYHRLVDTYNPDEYRLAVFKDAVEVEPAALNTAGQFEVMFNCKPQRYLMSGESTVEVEDGDKIDNPTPFDAQPMIMTEGYGTLTVNGYEIEIVNEVLGPVVLSYDNGSPIQFDSGLVEAGDPITIERVDFAAAIKKAIVEVQGTTVTNVQTITPPANASWYSINLDGNDSSMVITFGQVEFTAGTADTITDSWTVRITLTSSGGAVVSYDANINTSIKYDGADKIAYSFGFTGTGAAYLQRYAWSNGTVTADSSVTTLGNPTYIDCELGEVYKIENGSLISLNRLTDLGSKLPVLSPGENEITFDNTFTSVEIIPHWWVV